MQDSDHLTSAVPSEGLPPALAGSGERTLLTQQDEKDCLHYDFDADSKGDADSKILGIRMVTAAKDYPDGTCFPCMGPIAKGERHRTERGLFDGKARTVRSCSACCAAMAAYRGDDFEAIERRYSKGRAWQRSRADSRTARYVLDKPYVIAIIIKSAEKSHGPSNPQPAPVPRRRQGA